ncbi:(2Fe-2S)-binding protein [Actinopolymorpha pittospori]|uniref:Molibdopterin-dependent oxidoreductase YjgC n=1 Tax=Actinopolymorpha pittospori TaxID=648752 RepID=A0A927MY38_9ACTN|nr:(2Fe-2S)-binding protein [Actinopolymorpha pittospori]MBE1607403.1 putative molibdopterin-dependent oxidoreductase YjgC [Actinopolymorpha pittospori]
MSDTILVDGRPVAVGPDQTVAAALLAAGIRSWRTTRKGRPRGLFCGIGVCFDCLVTVNGRGSVRACLVPARPGDVVTTGRPDQEPASAEVPADPSAEVPADALVEESVHGSVGSSVDTPVHHGRRTDG